MYLQDHNAFAKALILPSLWLTMIMSTGQVIAQPDNSDQAVATFAGGCFWCMEPPFDELEGVSSTISGYIGGHVENPSYEQVTTGRTGHAEAMQVTYDPEVVDYATLLDVYWQNIDPLDSGGQFCDRGSSYRSTIFVHTAEQRELAEASKQEIVASGQLNGEIVTPIEEATTFYPAEEYHQDYYEKNPLRYRFYKWNCGREQRLEEVWGEN
ncbi:peptide methionine sulfoxide reductase MsrA [Pseudohongiella nitratireducens]|uniref:Peptide methionine sulfoxide reductase MsrA n=1 Tax=Pseudohongiella nitratireducens TaxID=1768907 RepID=A0A916QKR7_9GAMM|nr:peptide-methionine (S)-S-oxide reductase MsrA [Pseudohongiella nitratireducens]GFZ80467.1 peptide methionine sulfoxide reductase MsrA [Pseudohongiella nitratireducens]